MCPEFLQFWCNVIHCKAAYKTVIYVPYMLEHVCYDPFSLKNSRFGRHLMLNWLNFVYCLKFTHLRPDLST